MGNGVLLAGGAFPAENIQGGLRGGEWAWRIAESS